MIYFQLEQPPSTTESHDLQGIDEYLQALGDARTARMASEVLSDSPQPQDVAAALKGIRRDIAATFGDASEEHESGTVTPLDQMKADYWARASKVGVEHGAKEGYELKDYLTIGEPRSYEHIKGQIERSYPEGSVPRSLLSGVDAYHRELQINPAHATRIMMESFGRQLPGVVQRADSIREAEGCLPQEASARAVADFVANDVPRHIADSRAKYGVGDDAIRPVMNKSSFYPTERTTSDASLVLSEQDVKGMVAVYDTQSRPYSEAELAMGNDLAQTPEMQAAMLRVHEGLISVAEDYLAAHPERASGNMENFSEIFIPEYHGEQGERVDLLPNPKLVRAVVNNVMPAIALSLMRRGASVEAITTEDVQEGVRIASKEFKLFQSKIGQFDNPDPETRTIELRSTFQVVCPANTMFPNYLSAKLAPYYEEEKLAAELGITTDL